MRVNKRVCTNPQDIPKWLEYTLLGVGSLLLLCSFAIWLAPLGGLVWFFVKFLLPQWTIMDTFILVLLIGLFSLAYFISKICR